MFDVGLGLLIVGDGWIHERAYNVATDAASLETCVRVVSLLGLAIFDLFHA